MPQSTNLNKSPYFDDFDPIKNFYRVLFRPGQSIQARELTTLQSILQNQIENLSKSRFRQGSVIVPGEIIFDDKYNYVKVSSFTNNLQITDYIGSKLTGNDSGVVATVVNATAETETDSATLFVKYDTSGNSRTSSTFFEGETLTSNATGSPTVIVGITGSAKPVVSNAMGYGSAVTVNEGVYFINGTLTRNAQETIILEKYSNKPSAKVGFVVTEQIITPEEDLSLLDNAQGYSNFTAPGAHRLKISVTLDSRSLDFPDQRDFVELLVIENGVIKSTVENVENNLLQDVLARRTFDESGDYIVRDFNISLKEHLDDGENNGVYLESAGGLESKFIAELSPGKAYVRGYEIETTTPRLIEINKARDVERQEEISLSFSEGSNYTVKNLYRFPDILKTQQNFTGTGISAINSYQEINFYGSYTDLAFGQTTANIDNISPESENYWVIRINSLNSSTQVPQGTPYSSGSVTGQIRNYQLSSDNSFAIAIVTKGSTASFVFGATITMGSVSGTIVFEEKYATPVAGIAKTKYLKYLSGNSNATTKVFDRLTTQYRLGLFGAEYFTRIKCKQPINFTQGKTITGQSSGAYGIVESVITDTREVLLSKVVGQFSEGETLLSEVVGTSSPYNYIESEGSIEYFKPISVGAGYTVSGVTISLDGIDYTADIDATNNVNEVSGEIISINITPETRLNLGRYEASPVVEIEGDGSGAEYEAILNKNVIKTYNSSTVRSFFGSTEANNTFSGDVSSIDASFLVSNSETFSAVKGEYYITADNLNSRPDLDLSDGDIIRITDDAGTTRNYIVKFATPAGSSSTARIYVYGSVLSDFTSKTVSKIRSVLNGTARSSSLLPLPNKNVRTAVLNPTNTNINYTIQKEFVGTLGSSGDVAISVGGSNQQFLNYSADNYILTSISTGALIDLDGSVSLSGNNSTLNINLGSNYSGVSFKLIAPVTKFDTAPKTKTLVTDYEHEVNSGFADGVIALKHSDVLRIKSIHLSTDSSAATIGDPEITDSFIFDNGQRETYYDLARIILKPGAQTPINPILVVYDYFEHVGSSGTGDYFTVDSYTNVDYADIPNFNSSVYGVVSLADVVDFRPRVSDFIVGSPTSSNVPGYSDATTADSTNFDGTGSSVSSIPLYGTSFNTGFEYYVGRIDAIYISKEGRFVVSTGTPSLNPQVPDEISDSILLYHLNIPAYTFNTSDIKVKSFDNRRYTMRDIGKLEKRIEKLEYYTVLSLLEQDTLNSQVKDEYGNERFKNGILVDNFEGHGIGDTLSSDYKCAIDTQTGILRPSFYASQTSLIEKNSFDSERTSNGYKKTGDIVTLPYTSQSTITNPYATKTIQINPGRSTRFSGAMKLSPNIDEWKDIYTSPELIVNENSVFDTIKNSSSDLWGSIWNEWQVSWTGTPAYNLNNSTDSSKGSVNQFGNFSTNSVQALTRTRSRNGTQNRLTPYGSNPTSTSQRTVSNSYRPYARSKVVKFVATGLEPNTKLYAFFDGIDVNAWVNPDDVSNIITPFTSIAGYAEKGFGETIITDENGNISGQFLVPNGYAPILGKKTVDYINQNNFYNTQSTQRKFTAGTKIFRLTSSQTNSSDSLEVTTFVEAEYNVTGLPGTNTGSIISTRIPSISRRSVSNSDTVQYVGTSRVNVNQSGLLDPISQTFTINGFEEGVFLDSLDLYFENKTNTSGQITERPVTVYLTETDAGIPTRRAIPFSETSLNADTILRIRISAEVTNGETLLAGETITGKTSGAIGVIKNSLTVTTNNTRYNLILSNHNGIDFLPEEEIIVNRSPLITTTNFYIDKDAGEVEYIKVTDFGTSYSTVSGTTTISINGDNGGLFGTAATATAEIYDGRIYNITLTNKGSGYYTAPAVTITSNTGSGAKAEAKLRITNPAVKMGVSTSPDGTVRTRFKFDSPVYLENGFTYAFVVSSSSSDYTLYSSRVGDNLLNSTVIASAKPGVGSMFKSQNSSSWVEDPIEDIKFNINRCVFDTSATATVEFENEDLEYTILPKNPITVDATDGTSSLFGSNQRILKIAHPNHGMKSGDFVILSNISGSGSPSTIFGIPVELITGMHSISNVGVDDYCILIPNDIWISANVNVTGSGSGGGSFVRATTNKLYQVMQSQVSTLTFPSSSVSHSVRTTKGKAIDSTTSDEYTLDTPINITPGDNYFFSTPKVIASPQNEVLRKGGTLLIGKKSLEYTVSMQTSRDNVSPVLDLARANVITVGTKLDNPTGDETRFGAKSQTLTVPTNSAFTITTTPTIISTTVLTVSNVTGGSFQVTGSTNPPRIIQTSTNSSAQIVNVSGNTIKVIDVQGSGFAAGYQVTQGGVAATVTESVTKSGLITGWDSGTGLLKLKLTSDASFEVGDYINDNAAGTSPITSRFVSAVSGIKGFLYVDEVSPTGGSVYSKYLTKEVTLETPAEAIDCRITANVYNNSDVKVLYKIKPDGSGDDFANIGWQYFNGTGLSDNNANIIPTSNVSLSSSVEDLSSYIEYKYSANSLTPFKSFAIKILFTGSNPALAPRVEDIRVIAHS